MDRRCVHVNCAGSWRASTVTAGAETAANWEILGLDNFRQNVQPIAVPAAPDLIVASIGGEILECPATITIEALIKNIGNAGAPAGLRVAFYDGAPPTSEFLGVVDTTLPILPGQALLVSYAWPIPDGQSGEPFEFYAAIDDDGTGPAPGEGASALAECDEDNNVSPGAPTQCSVIE